MGWILLIGILILLSGALLFITLEDEKYLVIKVVLLYLLSVITLNIGSVSLPFGLTLGLLIVVKKNKTNLRIKRLALLCGLLFFLLSTIFPAIPLTDLLAYRENFAELNRFSDVQLVEYLKPDTQDQAELRRYVTSSQDENRDYYACILMFRTWVLNSQKILIKDPEWLYSKSPIELNFQDSYIYIDDNKTEAFLQFADGKKYFALFKKKDEKYYPAMIIRYGEIKPGQRPNSFY